MTRSTRQLRNDLTSLFQSETLEDKDAAERLGITVRGLKDIQAKSGEVETARLFLEELGVAFSDVQTLKEFYGSDKDPRTGRDLDYVCPDVVVIIDGQPIGIELTAFAPDEDDDRLIAIKQQISEQNRTEIAGFNPDLSGFVVFISLNERNILRSRDVRQFIVQLSELVRHEKQKQAFKAREEREIVCKSEIFDAFGESMQLLSQHVKSITIHYHPTGDSLPFSIPLTGFTRTFGTSQKNLSDRLSKKRKARSLALCEGLSELWLLVHATGEPISSRIAPLYQHEVDTLLESPSRQLAIETGFDRVFLWDGVHDGHVEFVSGKCKTYTQG
ncbi:MAG: hypothetical protein JNL18_14420 [Planctomycetaceae bacterium]|nr:hypothetical protein [Planctomycetaceae bacterium]